MLTAWSPNALKDSFHRHQLTALLSNEHSEATMLHLYKTSPGCWWRISFSCMTVTSCHCTVRVTELPALEGSSQWPSDLHLFSPLKKVLKGHRPQGRIGAVIPIATHCAVSGGDPPVGVLVGCPSHCPWGMFLTAPTLLRAIPEQVWHEQGLSCTCYGQRCLLCSLSVASYTEGVTEHWQTKTLEPWACNAT
jgi:hypothetical protein